MKQATTKKLLAIAFFMMASACTVQPTLSVPVRHDLGVATGANINNATINVNAPSWLWDERIRYRLLYSNPTAIAYYNLDPWEAPVPALLEHRLNIPEQGRPVNIKIQLMQFEQQFESTSDARVIMVFKVSVFSGDGSGLLSKRVFNFSKSTKSPDAIGAIESFVDLTDLASKELSSWVASLLETNH